MTEESQTSQGSTKNTGPARMVLQGNEYNLDLLFKLMTSLPLMTFDKSELNDENDPRFMPEFIAGEENISSEELATQVRNNQAVLLYRQDGKYTMLFGRGRMEATDAGPESERHPEGKHMGRLISAPMLKKARLSAAPQLQHAPARQKIESVKPDDHDSRHEQRGQRDSGERRHAPSDWRRPNANAPRVVGDLEAFSQSVRKQVVVEPGTDQEIEMFEEWKRTPGVCFVLDTNVLMKSPMSAVFSFGAADVYVPMKVIGELEGVSRNADHIGQRAHDAQQCIERLIGTGAKVSGKVSMVETPGNILGASGYFILQSESFKSMLPREYSVKEPDNQILNVAKALQAARKASVVVLVTRDINLRLKAASIAVPAVTFPLEKRPAYAPRSFNKRDRANSRQEQQ